MRNVFFVTMLCLAVLVACKNETATQTTPTTVQPENAPASTGITAGPAATLPIIPLEEYKALAENTNSIDIVPFESNLSMSIPDKASCYQFVANHILDTQVAEMPCTKPNGRIFFNKDGDSILEANIYYTEQCKYLVFYKAGNNTPLYATQITEQGKKYFESIYGANAMQELQKLQSGNQK